jgi:hypothetical protein
MTAWRWRGSSAARRKYKHTQSFQDYGSITGKGMENSALRLLLSVWPQMSTTLLTRSTRQPCTAVWVAATTANSAWHSVHWWGSIQQERYYEHKAFPLFGTEISTRGSTCHWQHRFWAALWCRMLGKNLIAPHVKERRLMAPYYKDYLENKLLLHLEDVPLATRKLTSL